MKPSYQNLILTPEGLERMQDIMIEAGELEKRVQRTLL